MLLRSFWGRWFQLFFWANNMSPGVSEGILRAEHESGFKNRFSFRFKKFKMANSIWRSRFIKIYQIYLFSILVSLSRFLAKTQRLKKLPWKAPQKICRSESTFNCRSNRLCIKMVYNINTHNISGMRNYVNNPDWRVIITNYVCKSEWISCSARN